MFSNIFGWGLLGNRKIGKSCNRIKNISWPGFDTVYYDCNHLNLIEKLVKIAKLNIPSITFLPVWTQDSEIDKDVLKDKPVHEIVQVVQA